MSIPTCLAVNEVTLLGLIATEYVLDRTRHHVVDTRHTVCRRGTLVEDKGRMTLARSDTLVERIVSVPLSENLSCQTGQVEALVFGEFLAHCCIWFFIYFNCSKRSLIAAILASASAFLARSLATTFSGAELTKRSFESFFITLAKKPSR